MIVKKAYALLLLFMTKCLGIDAAKKFDAKLRFKKTLNLKNPTALSDKVTYLELHKQSPLASSCTDKYAVRDFVQKKGLGDILVPVVGGPWSDSSEVPFQDLPDRFILKATHGCKMNYIVANKEQLDESHCRNEMARWLNTSYGTYSLEPHYLNIPHRIYAEKLLDTSSGLIDYKFHCLNGIPLFVLVCSDRKSSGGAMAVTLDLFDMEWKHIDGLVADRKEIPGDGSIPRPAKLAEMIEISKKLSAEFQFVRVDLYELDGKIYFGELTFSPANCVFPYFSREFDLEMGKMLTI